MSTISQYVFPASFAQRRLWFLDSLTPGLPTYNVPSAYRLEGPLNEEALQGAFDSILQRHEVFRTVFRLEGGQPVQVVSDEPHPESRLQPTDLSGAAPAEARVLAAGMAHEEAMRPFDLEHGPLIRSHLVRVAADEHVLIVTMHHIVTDAWSRGIFFRELGAQYQALNEGYSAAVPPLELQYGDFAVWQHAWLQGEELQKRLAYWREQLKPPIPVMDLPSDRPRPAMQSSLGARLEVPVPDDVAGPFLDLCRREEATLFTAAYAAFSVLLHRYTAQDDILVGTPIAGRHTGDVEGLIGFFVNTLVLRTTVLPEESFLAFLARTKRTVLDAFAHQDVPFEKLVEELKPERDASRNPFFQAMLVVQHAGEGGIKLPGLKVSGLPGSDRESTKFDLTLFLTESAGRLKLVLEHSTELFDSARVRSWGSAFVTLLRGIVADPGSPLARLPLLSAEERRHWVEECSGPALDYPRNSTMHAQFLECAARCAAAPALVSDAGVLTYRELSARTARLAHFLQRRGMGPGSLVAVALPRSADLIVSLIAVMETGAAYVPLDPEYPVDRLRFMMEDTGAALLLTTSSLAHLFPARAGTEVVRIEDIAAELAALPATPPLVEVPPENPAYLIYTSGSTGMPKAVVIRHRNAVAFIAWARTVFSPDDLAGVLAGTSVCFDLSIFEIFVTLCSGGAVILVPNALALHALRSPLPVTLVNTVPSVMDALLKGGRLPTSVRVVNLAGEPLPQRLVKELYTHPHVTRVYDLYGPSEDTTYSTYTLRKRDGRASIGRPIANTAAYVLDAQGEPAPPGVPGELFLSGDGVALGYLNRPELTAERFLPDSFAPEKEARMYRTGDLVRYLPDQTLEYLGRLDNQVKLRGFRIELGEVEVAISTHPAVAACAVTAPVDESGNRALLAFVVPRDDGLQLTELLQLHLKSRLPGYMVPSRFVLLDSLPLSPNGKVDRRRLIAPAETAAPDDVTRVKPETTLEAVVIQIWEGLLPGRRIDPSDDFFAIGGHSLLAARMVDEIARATGLKLPLTLLFQGATVRDIARHLLSDLQSLPVPEIVTVQAGKPGVPGFFMAHGDFTAGGFYCRSIATAAGPDQPVYAIPPVVPDGSVDTFTVESMARRHLAAVRKVQPHGPYRLGGYCVGGLVAFELARLLRAAGEKVDYLVVVDSNAVNANYRWIQPMVEAVCALTERDLTRRADRFTYLMSRVRRLRYLPRFKLLTYMGGWPGRLLMRRARRLLRHPVPAVARKGTTPSAAAVKLAHHFTRAQMLYFPRRFDGKVDIVWATVQRRVPTIAEVGWARAAAEVELSLAPSTHVEVVTTHLPGVVAAALARLTGRSGVTG